MHVKQEWANRITWMVDANEGTTRASRGKAGLNLLHRIGKKWPVKRLIHSQEVGVTLIMGPFDPGYQGKMGMFEQSIG